VNSYSSRIRLAEMTITNIQEIVDNLIWWIRSVDEEEFIMSYPLLEELLSVVLGLVQYSSGVKPDRCPGSLLSMGPMKAANLPGMIQLMSPLSTRS
jgi:hypothetical protein